MLGRGAYLVNPIRPKLQLFLRYRPQSAVPVLRRVFLVSISNCNMAQLPAYVWTIFWILCFAGLIMRFYRTLFPRNQKVNENVMTLFSISYFLSIHAIKEHHQEIAE